MTVALIWLGIIGTIVALGFLVLVAGFPAAVLVVIVGGLVVLSVLDHLLNGRRRGPVLRRHSLPDHPRTPPE